jgi:hypothetical protein
MPGPQPYTYAEGGGALPAYGEDFFQRIVGVNWPRRGVIGDTIFVVGEYQGNQLSYVRFKGTNPEVTPIVLPEPPLNVSDGSGFYATGSAYADVTNNKPVFLVCGFHVEGAFNDYIASIYSSKDGLIWSKVREQAIRNSSSSTTYFVQTNGLVWDPANKSFYYDQCYVTTTFETGAAPLDQIFASPDGNSWDMVSSMATGAVSGFSSEFSTIHCAHNDCIDGFGQHVPDGVIWQDSLNKLVVRPPDPPAIDYGQARIGYPSDSAIVEIVDGKIGLTTTASIPGVATVNCVAGNSGVFLAGGAVTLGDNAPGAVASSIDGGKTWQPLFSTRSSVVTMVAARL